MGSMDERVEQQSLQAWRGFLTAHSRIVERLSNELEAEAGLPLTWYEVLVILSEADGGRLRMHQLADSLLLSRSAATRFIDRMETAGLVERIQSLTDRRGTFVTLSSAGRNRLRDAGPIYVRGIQEHFTQHLEDAELTVLRSVMTRLGQASGNGQRPAASERQHAVRD